MAQLGTPETIGIVVVAVASLRLAEKAIDALLAKKKNGVHGAETSGAKAPEFWDMRFKGLENQLDSLLALCQDIKDDAEALLNRGRRR